MPNLERIKRLMQRLEGSINTFSVNGPLPREEIGTALSVLFLLHSRGTGLTKERVLEVIAGGWDRMVVAGLAMAIPPCLGCNTTTEGRSACPLCGKVFCQKCAEKPYAFCCDEGRPL